jgi:hypothetical protein
MFYANVDRSGQHLKSILIRYKGKCPKCGKIARTPLAKQCRFVLITGIVDFKN